MTCEPNLQPAKPDAFVAAAFRGGRLFIKTTAQSRPHSPSSYTHIETNQMKPEIGSLGLNR
jgi:hypothetical protein